jgi:hypothetical protein
MKTHFLFLILIVGISCASLNKTEECPTLVKTLEETFKDDFFNQYKDEEGKLNVITEFKDIYQEINECEKSLSFTLDSVNRGQSKYLSINDYRQAKIVRLQIACYNNESEPYYIQYSTSYKIDDNGKLELISNVSPFIDTVQIKR